MAQRIIRFIAIVSTSILVGAAAAWHVFSTTEIDYDWELDDDEQ